MINYEYDDGGRKAAGFKGDAGDCVVRATAILTGRPYRECYAMMADANARSKTGIKRGKAQRSARNGVWKDAYQPVWETLGLVKAVLPAGPRPTYSEAAQRYGNCIVVTAKHVCAIVDGVLRDLFDGRTYEWEEETRERKAQSVWVLA